MGFRNGAYARIWSVENKGNYSVAKVSVSRKNKETGNYDVEFQEGFVRLVGSAHEFMQNVNITEKGYAVKISNCDVTNKYDSAKKKNYYNFVIFGLEDANGNSGTSNNGKNRAKSSPNEMPASMTSMADPDDEYQLPF